MKKVLYVMILLTGLSSCLVGPKYKRPAISEYKAYAGADAAAAKDSVALIKWTEVYKDPELTKMIRTVLDKNLDLLAAMARVEEARASYGISRAGVLPSVGYKVNGNLSDIGENAKKAGAGIDGQTYGGYATMNWELDLWGKLRHQKRSAWAQYLATQNNAQAVRVSLVAETATLYFKLRDQDNRLEIAKKTVQSRTESLKMITERFEKGYVSELDRLQAQQQLALASAVIPDAEQQIVITRNALRVLTGQAPGDIPRGQTIYGQQLPPTIPAGIPSDLLKRRPDIIAAEQTLISETEAIGVATAMRFPSLSLTGILGYASPSLSTVVNPTSMALGIGGSLTGPVFEFGKNRNRAAAQRFKAEQYNYQYQKTVLTAFSEVDNSLESLRYYKAEHEAYATALAAASKAMVLTEARYNDGYSNYLELLNQQDNLFNAQLNESATQSLQNIAVVNLFKALGGGW